MLIRSRGPFKRTPVFASQARLFARCIRDLERAARAIRNPYDPDAGDGTAFLDLPNYTIFHDAAYACDFVCDDFVPNFPFEKAKADPEKVLRNASLFTLRHYTHALMRAERNAASDGWFSPVCEAIQSGSLGLVARRLESDESLYDG